MISSRKSHFDKYFLLWMGAAAIIVQLPVYFIFPADLHSDTNFSQSLKGDTFFWLTMISLFMCVPAVLEIILDLFSALFVKADVFTTLGTRVWVIAAVIVTAAISTSVACF